MKLHFLQVYTIFFYVWRADIETSLDLSEARDRVMDAVASAGLYAKNLHLTSDR